MLFTALVQVLSLQVALTAALAVRATGPTTFSNSTISLVRANAISSSTKSWELGTLAEALLEFSWPSLAVFTTKSYPPTSVNTSNPKLYPSDVITLVNDVLAIKPSGILPLMTDGAVGDPASVGPAVLLANFTNGKSNKGFSKAAADQLNYLLNVAPRTSSGAISHRSDQTQLWADFVYMAPPFIADYAVWQGGDDEETLLQEAYDQCRLYRDVLYSPDAGLWQHIELGSWSDTTHWGTGNAWAAAGMLRVLKTINKSSVATSMRPQQTDLTEWINEILTSSFKYQKSDGSLRNVIDDSNTFSDSSTTALISATAYRMATFTKDKSLIKYANKGLAYIKDNLDSKGWLQNAVDPYAFNVRISPGAHSPEGQSFVLLLHSAVRDYLQANKLSLKKTTPIVSAKFAADK